MPVKTTKSGYLQTPLAARPACDAFSFAATLRLDGLTAATGFQDIFSGGGFRLYINNHNLGAQSTYLYAQVTTSSGAVLASKPRFPSGTVCQVAAVYDRGDASASGLYVEGVRYPFATTSTAPIAAASSRYSLGNTTPAAYVAHTVADLLMLRGYALTAEDREALLDDPDSSSTIGAGSGADRTYWSFAGEVGSSVAVGDPGITTEGTPAKSFTAIGNATSGSSIAYSAPLDYVRAAAAVGPYVDSSGRSIVVPLGHATTGAALTALTGGLSVAPTIEVDGSPIQLRTLEEGTYANANTTAVFFPLRPEEPTIQPGQVVTISAPARWLATELGTLPAMDGLPVDNRAGRVSSPVDPEVDPIRVGINFSQPPISHWGRYWLTRNRAKGFNIDDPSVYVGDKIVKPASAPVVSIGGNGVDKTGPPLPLGLYLVRWDDDFPSAPTRFGMNTGSAWIAVTEELAYANPGDADGKGKVRVFRVQRAVNAMTLVESIDAGATSLRLSGPVAAWTASGTTSGGWDGYVEIGDEKIRIGARVGTTNQFTGCTRGWDGTTAAPHAAGSAAASKCSRRDGSLALGVSNASGVVRYSNLAVLDPTNWTPPETPGMVTIPPLAWDEFDATFLEKFGGGLGVMRFMPSTHTFLPCAEVEHVPRRDAEHWAAPIFKDQLRFASVREFSPATSPYIYTPIPNAAMATETYEATLSTPLEAGSPGSEVTASLTCGDPNGLCYGTRLMRGGETLRIRAILGGGSYRLVRGVDGTTPVAHPAGPMTAGWRIPTAEDVRWKLNSQRYMEVIVDPATSSPPRLGYLVPGSAFTKDASITARRNLTFPEGIAPGAATFKATPASSADWYYLAKGLELVVGSEVMTIESANQGAGTVTVAARPSGGAHSVGATGRTRSSLMLWRDAADTARAWAAPISTWSMVRPTGPWSYIASIGIPKGDEALMVPASPQTFDPALAATKPETLPSVYLPYAIIGRVCSLVDGAPDKKPTWPWVNIPMTATNDLVRHIATEVRDHLDVVAGRKVFVELANEVWNFSFPFPAQRAQMDQLMGSTDPARLDWWITRQDECVAIFRSVFAEQGRGGEIKSVLAWQTSLLGPVLAAARRLGVEPDYVSMAPYLKPPDTQEYKNTVDVCDDAQAGDLFSVSVEHSRESLMFATVNQAHQVALREHQAATGRLIPTVYYEGDLDRVIPKTPAAVDAWARCRDIVRHPNYYFTQRKILDIFRRVGKCEAVAIYSHAAGTSGASPVQWGVFERPTQRWGYGDGRDGSVDNRACTFRNAGPLDSPDAENVSVRFQGILDAYHAFLAADPSAEPDPDPVPEPDPEARPHRRRFIPVGGGLGRMFRGFR